MSNDEFFDANVPVGGVTDEDKFLSECQERAAIALSTPTGSATPKEGTDDDSLL